MDERRALPFDRVTLRAAAGGFWLVDTAQDGRPYRPPLRLNDAGAALWRALARGTDAAALAAELAASQGIPGDEALRDVQSFISQLKNKLEETE